MGNLFPLTLHDYVIFLFYSTFFSVINCKRSSVSFANVYANHDVKRRWKRANLTGVTCYDEQFYRLVEISCP